MRLFLVLVAGNGVVLRRFVPLYIAIFLFFKGKIKKISKAVEAKR
jgi:hypothetical protein